jgi:hypothetical protein
MLYVYEEITNNEFIVCNQFTVNNGQLARTSLVVRN